MKTIAELEKHLNDYRLKKVDVPSYAALIELVETSTGAIEALSNYMTKAKEREAKLIKEAFIIGSRVGFYQQKRISDLSDEHQKFVYRSAGLEELT